MNTLLMDQKLKKHLLQTFVPVNALTEDHLNTLLRDTQVEVICRGQVIAQRGDCDNTHIYLLSGSVSIDTGTGDPQHIDANNPFVGHPLAHHQPRLETVTATDDCQILRFDSNKLDAMLAWDQAANYIILDITGQRDLDEDADWMLTLLRSNLFYKVPPMNIRQILTRFRSTFAHSGDVIVRQGEVGDSCYFVKEGSVSVFRAADEKGKSELVADLGVGRCFGEDALVNDAPRNATVMMRENGVLMKLDKQDFYLLLKSPPVRGLSLTEVDRDLIAGAQLIDVRTEGEFELAHAPHALNMPLTILKLKSRLLDRDTHYITYCNSGRRSSAAAFLLVEEGYNVTVLRNGFDSLSLAQRLRFIGEGNDDYLTRERQLATDPIQRLKSN
ncbi:MAG: protein kinase [Verrucomicrobiaceae bacterium]|nr:protein kinase [Verrucomicrobiaceae bacterium]